MRSEIERTLAEVDARVAKAQAQITAAERARVPPRLLRQPTRDLATVVADLQEPRAAVAGGDYRRATQALDGMKGRIEKVVADVAAATTSQTSRRRR